MTTQISIGLGLVILAFFLGDALFFDNAAAILLGGKFLGLVEWVAFWR